ncbi:periplasmic heavy metal sensor [Lujinxingia vulgaris]|uniref:Periplasmic heavy metal sensor n=1 Tax=Lujinxingia vulgaris TaxID=2600176 RepID=A0A5C6X3F9_9DELT|nr:Spy/CpxP family protein refolding chaperone [Lujinxingia vulgaris]TXD33531.1 periplasmic heavy metal sensor [Lujinxingia vulgaris]
MNRLIVTLATLIALAMVLPATATAQQRPHRHQDTVERLFPNPRHLIALRDELGLSEAQQTQIRTLLEGKRDAHKADRQALREAHQEMRELVTSDAAADAIRAKLDEVLELENQLKRERLSLALELRAILTPEQRTRLQELSAERREQRQERRQRRGKRRQGPGQPPTTY